MIRSCLFNTIKVALVFIVLPVIANTTEAKWAYKWYWPTHSIDQQGRIITHDPQRSKVIEDYKKSLTFDLNAPKKEILAAYHPDKIFALLRQHYNNNIPYDLIHILLEINFQSFSGKYQNNKGSSRLFSQNPSFEEVFALYEALTHIPAYTNEELIDLATPFLTQRERRAIQNENFSIEVETDTPARPWKQQFIEGLFDDEREDIASLEDADQRSALLFLYTAIISQDKSGFQFSRGYQESILNYLISKIETTEQALQLINVKIPQFNHYFSSVAGQAFYSIMPKLLELCRGDLTWTRQMPVVEKEISQRYENDPLHLFGRLFFDNEESFYAKLDQDGVSKYLLQIASTLESGSFAASLREIPVQDTNQQLLIDLFSHGSLGAKGSDEYRKDRARHDSTYYQNGIFLLSILEGLARGGVKLYFPETRIANLASIAESLGFALAPVKGSKGTKLFTGYPPLREYSLKKKVIDISKIKNGSALVKIQKYYKYEAKSAADFIRHYSPSSLPKIVAGTEHVLLDPLKYDSLNKFEQKKLNSRFDRTYTTEKALLMLYIKSLIDRTDDLISLNPTAEDIARLLEIPNHLETNVSIEEEEPEIFDLWKTFAINLLTSYFKHPSTTSEDAYLVLSYKVPPASEQKALKTEIADSLLPILLQKRSADLKWLNASSMPGDRFLNHRLSPSNVLRKFLLQSTSKEELTDAFLVRKALILILGSYVDKVASDARQKESELPVSLYTAIIASKVQDPKNNLSSEERDQLHQLINTELKEIILAEAEETIKDVKRVLANYIIARQNTGFFLPLEDNMNLNEIKQKLRELGYSVQKIKKQNKAKLRIYRLSKCYRLFEDAS